MLAVHGLLHYRHWFAGLLLLVAIQPAAAGAASGRVMSVNQCVEQMIGSFATDKLVSVTWLSHQSHAPLNEVLRHIPANHAEIEEVLSLAPDLVIGGEYGAPGLQALLQKFGIGWRQMPLHQNFEMYFSNWALLGHWLQHEQETAQIIRDIRATMMTLNRQLKPLNINAVMVNPNGWAAGSNNFQHAFLEAAGLHNMVADNGFVGWTQLSLELLLIWRPDLLIMANAGYTGRSIATYWQRHPVLASYSSRYPVLVINSDSLSCTGNAIANYSRQLLKHLVGSATAANPEPNEADG